jgi:hypothetical protein
MPASYVKASPKRSKIDAADAAAICEAVTRPSMRFAPVKTDLQQAALMHRSRDLLIHQRTQLINVLRAHLAEIGLVVAPRADGLQSLLTIVHESADTGRFPEPMQHARQALVEQLLPLAAQIGTLERCIQKQHRDSETSQRLKTISGIGVIGATAIASTATDPSAFKSGRELAASQVEARRNIEAGRPPFATSFDRWRHSRDATCAGPSRQASMADEAAQQDAGKKSRRRARQQDSPDRMGHPGKRQHLSSASARGNRLNRLGSGSVRHRPSTATEL